MLESTQKVKTHPRPSRRYRLDADDVSGHRSVPAAADPKECTAEGCLYPLEPRDVIITKEQSLEAIFYAGANCRLPYEHCNFQRLFLRYQCKRNRPVLFHKVGLHPLRLDPMATVADDDDPEVVVLLHDSHDSF